MKMNLKNFKMPTLKQAILFATLAFIFTVIGSMFLGTAKGILAMAFLGFICWAGYKYYKSTPQERIQWGKKYKILALFFPDPQNKKQ